MSCPLSDDVEAVKEKPRSSLGGVVEEIRDIRKRLSSRFDNDVDRLCDHLLEIERQHPGRIVRHHRSASGASST